MYTYIYIKNHIYLLVTTDEFFLTFPHPVVKTLDISNISILV